MTIQKFVDALQAALEALEEVDEREMNALLARWHAHRHAYMPPYGTPPDMPAFQPRWDGLTLEDSTAQYLHFERYQYSENDHVFVPTEFLLDPDGWIAEDKKECVTKETWRRQRDRAIDAQAAARLEAQAEALRKAGFKVEKQ